MTVIELRPSRLLAMLLVALHLAAAFSFLLGFGAGAFSAAGLLMLVGSAWHCWRRSRQQFCRLGLQADGKVLVDPGGAAERRLLPLPSSVVSYPAVWLVWRMDGEAETGVLLLMRDQLAPHAWRELQVWLRLRARMRLGGPQGSP
ncbi:protein YgfX [Zoogloea sp.]|uniref:protein YgfX n=1 Tax=Zoogloea sp. TaxID=49181 RepID=UPI0035B471BE